MDYGESGAGGEFLQFARGRASPLRQCAYVLCGDWHLARDLVRDTLATTYWDWPRVRQVDDPDAYVRRVLLDQAWVRWRCREKDGSAASLILRPPGPGAAAGAARPDSVLRVLLGLPFRQRATIVLRYMEGLSQAETAELLRCSERTVRWHSYRALAALRKCARSADWRLLDDVNGYRGSSSGCWPERPVTGR